MYGYYCDTYYKSVSIAGHRGSQELVHLILIIVVG